MAVQPWRHSRKAPRSGDRREGRSFFLGAENRCRVSVDDHPTWSRRGLFSTDPLTLPGDSQSMTVLGARRGRAPDRLVVVGREDANEPSLLSPTVAIASSSRRSGPPRGSPPMTSVTDAVEHLKSSFTVSVTGIGIGRGPACPGRVLREPRGRCSTERSGRGAAFPGGRRRDHLRAHDFDAGSAHQRMQRVAGAQVLVT